MDYHKHSSNTVLMKAPAGLENCGDLPVTMLPNEDGTNWVVSFWRPNADELKMLNEGGSVTVYVMGHATPPISVGAVSKE